MKLWGSRGDRRRSSLLTQASVTNAVVMIMGAWGIAALILWNESGLLRRQLEVRAQTSADFLASQSEFPLLTGNREELKRAAESARGNDDVLYVVIADASGKILAQAGRRAPFEAGPLAPAESRTRIVESERDLPQHLEVTQPVAPSAGQGLLDWEADRQHPSQPLGVVRIGLSMQKQNALYMQTVRLALVLVVLATVAVSWVQHSRLRRLLRPLGRLIEFTQRVAAGDLSQRAPLGAWNEVDDLTRSFNEMVTQVEASRGELLEMVDKAQEASRLKSQFVANMSHEIRTPMNGIIGMTEFTLGTTLSAVQREYLEAVIESAESLLNVINDVLDFSKIEAGKMELSPVEFDLAELVEQTVRALALKAHQKHLGWCWRSSARCRAAWLRIPSGCGRYW